MIFDTMENASLYYGVAPRLQQAFELLAQTDLNALPAGKTELDGSDIFVNISETNLKRVEDAKLEIHNTYVDIQILLVGEQEGFGWTPRAALTQPVDVYNEQKDIQFFNDAHQTIVYLRKGQFTILMPEDGHAPMIGSGAIKKAIVKVRL